MEMKSVTAKYIIIPLIMLLMVASSCFKRENEADRKDGIPQEKMIDIITDLYITDGLLVLPVVHHWYDSKDSISAYRDVIASHGYTKEEFDRTMRFYFIKRPKQLMKIYEHALARLSEMETRYDQEVQLFQSRMTTYWKGRSFYASPGKEGSDSTEFDIRIDFSNIYYLSFTATVYPDDQTVNPKPVIYTCHPDSAETGSRHYVKTLDYIKDGQQHKYVYQINDPNKTRLRFMGNLFDAGNNPSLEKHFLIEEITLNY